VPHGEFVPWADQLAVIAAENTVSDRFTELNRDGSVVFDGQITDAAPRVEPVGRDDRLCRADLDAARAGSAMAFMAVGRALKRQVGEYLTEEKPGAAVLVDQAGLLADPAQLGIARQCPFQRRG
jgi:hypothetical protein